MTRHHPNPADPITLDPEPLDGIVLDETDAVPVPVPDEPATPSPAGEAESDPDPDNPDNTGPPDPPPGRPHPPTWVVSLLVALLVLALAGGAVLLLQVRAAARTEDDRTGALQAARQMVVNLMTLNHTAPQQSLDRVLQGSTGQFREQFSTEASAIKTVLQQAQVSSSGDVSEAGVAELDGDTATVLVASTATVKNSQAPQGEPRQYRMLVKLQKQSDAWLVSDVEFVP
ncbi:MAG: hypothetical protein JWR81_1318 [Pseudonocardia sp.]|jgi:Mce-associated membrane protein|nr:hypothetical protein [Pseudonocardia sp.]MDT7618394.1 Mce-associated rane protein [Pseudonocardiales bacterium]